MGLYERMTGEEQPRIRQHSLMAIMGEWERGRLTGQQAGDALGLSASERVEMATLLDRLVYPREAISLGGLVAFSNIGTSYDGTDAGRGLGLARLQLAGITQLIFDVKVNKVGSGTQSWQLWNDTDGAEVAVIDDAGAGGVKNLSVTVDFPTPLAAAQKVVRVRGKSTTNGDDPIYYGASLSLRRAALLTALELHEITVLTGELEPYKTAGAMRARLGV
jgi:hypothetical protein